MLIHEELNDQFLMKRKKYPETHTGTYGQVTFEHF